MVANSESARETDMTIRIAVFSVVSALLFTACSDNDDVAFSDAAPTLTILVTNDDGIGSPGIDNLVNELSAVDNVEVMVVAPAEEQSGFSDMVSDTEVAFEDSATISGVMGTAVFGTPGDAVNVALSELNITPNLIVSGTNAGQNVGPGARFSGTVGAAQIGARAGFPAVASSAGQGEIDSDFTAAAEFVIAWIEENRMALLDGSASADTVTSFNVPECTAGSIRGLVQVPLADAVVTGVNHTITDCSVEPPGNPVDDIDALIQGFATQTQLPLDF